MTVIWSSGEGYPIRIPKDRPYVILNAAMTLDGKISTKACDSKISCREDLRRVHELRGSVDAVMIGIRTLLIDNPKLNVRFAEGKSPIKVIVDSAARTPISARVLTEDRDTSTLIAVTEKAPKERVEALKASGAEVIISGSGDRVDLNLLMKKLREMGIKILLLEGGGTLNWGMLKNGLVDEIRVAVAPLIVGGEDAVTLVEGEGIMEVRKGIRLKLRRIEQHGECLVLYYHVVTRSQGDEAHSAEPRKEAQEQEFSFQRTGL
jgi:2,5-diamino-6-(ribosylamino)-4(3H)-pyrimidinone 5'-phosphate reductase